MNREDLIKGFDLIYDELDKQEEYFSATIITVLIGALKENKDQELCEYVKQWLTKQLDDDEVPKENEITIQKGIMSKIFPN